MIKLDLDHPVFERLGDVIYTFSVILLVLMTLSSLLAIIEGWIALALLIVGLVFYGIGWSIRYILSGKKSYLFKKQIEIQLYKLRAEIERN